MIFTLTLPPSINRTYGVSRMGKIPFYKRKPVKDWEFIAGWEVKRQYTGKRKILTGKISMKIKFFFTRNRDIDSGLKVLLDLFQKQDIYLNDKQVIELIVNKYQDLEKPRVEVEINEVYI